MDFYYFSNRGSFLGNPVIDYFCEDVLGFHSGYFLETKSWERQEQFEEGARLWHQAVSPNQSTVMVIGQSTVIVMCRSNPVSPILMDIGHHRMVIDQSILMVIGICRSLKIH